ncbi:MAG: serine hydrolase domain-containing protein [Bacteroidota bacterium]|nr:serine hydrolase domain-containing protein [Bacteroidota bacterium]
MSYPGGTAFSYTNFGIGLNGYLVKVLSGIDFGQHVHDSIFMPLDMERSCFFLSDLNIFNLAIGYDPDGGPNPHYGMASYPGVTMRSRALELSNFAIMMINDGIFRGNRILEKESIDSMCVVQYPALSNCGLGLYRYQLQNANGYGLGAQGRWHPGLCCSSAIQPERTNCRGGHDQFQHLCFRYHG